MSTVRTAWVDETRDARCEQAAVFRAELRSWALLGVGSLAIAGVFAFLLAMSRVPGMENLVRWPMGFFAKGLVIHVVFSLVVWFLLMFALLASFAAQEVSGGRVRFAAAGRIGLALVAMSFPMLFAPAFHDDAVATLNNYVPVIIHPGYYAGLIFLATGVLMPVIRLLANVVGRLRGLPPLPAAMTAASIVYCLALVCFGLALRLVWGQEPSRLMHEHLFWGGGHLLQFIYALLMLTGWFVLARRSLGIDLIDPDIFRIAVSLVAIFTLPSLIFYGVMEPFGMKQTEAFRRLQFVIAFPSLLVAIGGLNTLLRRPRGAELPWHDPAFAALVLSPIVFGVGGVMGLLITGSDTRTPAHYHAVIAGVNLACMGLMLTYCLPLLARPAPQRVRLRGQIVLFGLGQLMASIGLYLAGGYGAPRKTPSGAAVLVDGAALGMYLHGIGALIAVIGGIMFVVTVFRALLAKTDGSPEASDLPAAVHQ